MIEFLHNGHHQRLDPGGHFARAREGGFRDTTAGDQSTLVAEIEAGRPWRDVVNERYARAKPWLHRIIADRRRTAFFGQLLPAGGGLALDIGSGWGQIARPLAAQRPVVALEPVAERMAFIRAAARQEGVENNLYFVEADYLDTIFDTRFSVITAIGVLEWAGAFQQDADPQARQNALLRKARQELAPGGALIIGIENRLGLKYLLGSPDDHLGVPDIALHHADLARVRWKQTSGQTLQSFTYSLAELAAMLRAAGFARLAFFGAFPDYKLPDVIVPLGDDGSLVNELLRKGPPTAEHNGYSGDPLPTAFQEELGSLYRSLAEDGIAHHFVPSFFVLATKDHRPDSSHVATGSR
jgi:SAM-dependent methyltransferase